MVARCDILYYLHFILDFEISYDEVNFALITLCFSSELFGMIVGGIVNW